MRLQRCVKASIMTQLVPLEQSWRDESNNIKEGHQWSQDHTSFLKMEVDSLSFSGNCGLLRSPLTTFICVIRFVSSIYFRCYWWCHNKIFGVPSSSLYLFISSLSSLLINYNKKRWEREKERKILTRWI